MSLNRRTILASAALGGPVVLLAPGAATRTLASAPLIGQQAPNFYRAKLGSYGITVVSDGARPMPLPAGHVRQRARPRGQRIPFCVSRSRLHREASTGDRLVPAAWNPVL